MSVQLHGFQTVLQLDHFLVLFVWGPLGLVHTKVLFVRQIPGAELPYCFLGLPWNATKGGLYNFRFALVLNLWISLYLILQSKIDKENHFKKNQNFLFLQKNHMKLQDIWLQSLQGSFADLSSLITCCSVDCFFLTNTICNFLLFSNFFLKYRNKGSLRWCHPGRSVANFLVVI